MSGYWPPGAIGIDPDAYEVGELPIKGEDGGFVPYVPPPPTDPSEPGGGVDPDTPLDYLTFRSPDGTLWRVSIDDNGEWVIGPAPIPAPIPAPSGDDDVFYFTQTFTLLDPEDDFIILDDPE